MATRRIYIAWEPVTTNPLAGTTSVGATQYWLWETDQACEGIRAEFNGQSLEEQIAQSQDSIPASTLGWQALDCEDTPVPGGSYTLVDAPLIEGGPIGPETPNDSLVE